jgi:hypothetical protein
MVVTSSRKSELAIGEIAADDRDHHSIGGSRAIDNP